MQVINALEEVVQVEHNLLVVRGDQVQMEEPMVCALPGGPGAAGGGGGYYGGGGGRATTYWLVQMVLVAVDQDILDQVYLQME